MSRKNLHIAPFNTSGVPITFVKAERKLGYDSRLVTLGKDKRNYQEDICLNLPFLNSGGIQFAKKAFSHASKLDINNQTKKIENIPLYWRPNGLPEKTLIGLRERLWQKKINWLFNEIDFWNFDIFQLDGGLEFFRDGRTIRKLKSLGKKVICCYTGSDLRTRGAIPKIDSLSDLNLTLEFDHLKLHPNIHHVFFPFELSQCEVRPESESKTIKIGHAPTNRQAKGSDQIIAAIKEIQSEHTVELVLIENLPHEESLTRKSECHIFVDQIGDLGYGINSLEALAMEIPVCSCLAPGFEKKYPEHPFVVIDEYNIKDQLVALISDGNLRRDLGKKGRNWVQKYHDAENVVKKIHQLAGLTKNNESPIKPKGDFTVAGSSVKRGTIFNRNRE